MERNNVFEERGIFRDYFVTERETFIFGRNIPYFNNYEYSVHIDIWQCIGIKFVLGIENFSQVIENELKNNI